MDVWREILVAVAGLTPQVITETLYYLTQKRDPPVAIAEIHILTTQPGRQRLFTDLLTPHHGRFYTFCTEYGVDPTSIAFDDRRTIAASFALRYGWSSGVAMAPYLLYHCVPTITLDNVSFKFNEHGSFERTALHHPEGVMLPQVGMAPHPSIRWLSGSEALLAWLRTSLVQQARPVVDALYAWSQFSVRGTWGMITSAWGSLCMHIFGEIGEQTEGLPWVRQFFAGNDVIAQMQPQFYPVTYQHVTHVYHRGASCCRYYLLRHGHFCASCPLISQEERLQRQRAWMKQLIEPQVTSMRG